MPRRNFLLTLSWDGTEFEGWQRLPGSARSIQGTVETALARVLGEEVEITGAGRTDRGVHAEGQAASFHSRTGLSPILVLEALGRELPYDLVATGCREVDPRFHARFRAKGKRYRYRLHVGLLPDPALHRWSHHVSGPLDLESMRAAAAFLVGERDFAALTNAKGRETLSRIDAVTIEVRGEVVDLIFDGPGFLYNQVRIMAAALLAVGERKLSPRELEEIVASRDRSRAPGALGAYGLCLVEVRYR
jgi:tRNA pseudouridine38-40 synthase